MSIYFVRIFFAPVLYLDPGSGSLLVQMALAAILGIGVAVRLSWGRIKGLFGKKAAPAEETRDDDEE